MHIISEYGYSKNMDTDMEVYFKPEVLIHY